MPEAILGAAERLLTDRLLEVSTIFDIYRSSSERWAAPIAMISAVPAVVRTYKGEQVPFRDREVLITVMPFLEVGNEPLFLAIGRLQSSPVEMLRDLYQRLQALEIERVTSVESKGLFLLLAKLSEDRRLFAHET